MLKQPTFFDTPPHRDGSTFSPSRDAARLAGLHERVFTFMRSGNWHTLPEIQAACGGTESSVGARIRDYRKPRFGGHTVDREYVADGVWRYRLIVKVP